MSAGANKRKRINVFDDDEDESPNARFNQAIDTVRQQAETSTVSTPPVVAKQEIDPESATTKKGSGKQTIQKTDYFTQEQLDKLDDLEYLIKKRKGIVMRRFEILGLLVEQCDVDAFIAHL